MTPVIPFPLIDKPLVRPSRGKSDFADENLIGAIQKLRAGQRWEAVDDFVTYRYLYLRRKGVFYEIVT